MKNKIKEIKGFICIEGDYHKKVDMNCKQGLCGQYEDYPKQHSCGGIIHISKNLHDDNSVMIDCDNCDNY